MEGTLNFGPQWLRTLSDSGSSLSSGAVSQFVDRLSGPTQYKLAEHRYGREEMLALYTTMSPGIILDLSDTTVMLEKPLGPLCLEPMSEDEQALLLSNVNSSLAQKQAGRPIPSTHRGGGGGPSGGRDFDSNSGRGRGVLGRSREDDGFGRRRDPWEDGYSRGGGSRSYSRGGNGNYQNTYDGTGPSVPGALRENYSRSMSNDNWRDAKSSGPVPEEERERDVHRGGGTRGWGSSRGWRDPGDRDHDFDSSRSRYPHDSGPRRIEYKRSRSSSAAQEDNGHDALPEWSTADADELEEGGTFDASGAFLPSKDRFAAKKSVSENDFSASKASDGYIEGPLDAVPKNIVFKSEHGTKINSTNSSTKKDLEPVSGTEKGTRGRQLPNSGCVESGLGSLPLVTDSDFKDSVVNGRTAVHASLSKDVKGPLISSDFVGNSSVGNPTVPNRTVDLPSERLFELPAAASENNRETFMTPWAVTETELAAKLVQSPQKSASPTLLDDQWYYRDPQGDIQGPFKNAEMAEWFAAGFFKMNLLVRSGTEGEFTTLGELIKLCGQIPFVPTVSPLVVGPPAPASIPQVAVNSSTGTTTTTTQSVDPIIQEQIKMHHLMQQQQYAAMLQSQQMQYIHHTQQMAAAVASGGLSLGPIIAGPSLYGHMLPQPGLLGSKSSALGDMILPSIASVPKPDDSRPKETVSSLWDIDPVVTKPAVPVVDQAAVIARERAAEQERLERERLAVQLERERFERERTERERLERLERERLEREEMEKQKKIQAELKLIEDAKRQLEEERRRLELERQQQLEDQRREARRIEAQHRVEEEQRIAHKKQELERQRLEEDKRKQLEAIKLKKEEEERSRIDQQRWLEIEERIKAEAVMAAAQKQHQQAEKKRIEEAKLKQAKLAPWALSGQQDLGLASSNLSEIQRLEAENHRLQQDDLRQQRLLAQQWEDTQRLQQQQESSTWKELSVTQGSVSQTPSLLEIQQEQERQLKEEKNRNQSHQAKSVVADLSLGSASVWGSAASSLFTGQPPSIWDNVEPPKKTKVPATPINSAAQFPSLPAPAKPQSQTNKPAKTTAKSQREEAAVQKLFESNKSKDELTQWCETVLQGLETSADIPTLIEFLKDIESPYEVHDYIRSYLGESKQVQTFAQQFLEKRIKIKNASKPKHEDSIWGPVQALNPQLNRKPQQQQQQQHTSVSRQQQTHGKQQQSSSSKQAAPLSSAGTGVGSGSGGGGKKKKRMLKVDSSILGFTVHADSERTNVGEIDKL